MHYSITIITYDATQSDLLTMSLNKSQINKTKLCIMALFLLLMNTVCFRTHSTEYTVTPHFLTERGFVHNVAELYKQSYKHHHKNVCTWYSPPDSLYHKSWHHLVWLLLWISMKTTFLKVQRVFHFQKSIPICNFKLKMFQKCLIAESI